MFNEPAATVVHVAIQLHNPALLDINVLVFIAILQWVVFSHPDLTATAKTKWT